MFQTRVCVRTVGEGSAPRAGSEVEHAKPMTRAALMPRWEMDLTPRGRTTAQRL